MELSEQKWETMREIEIDRKKVFRKYYLHFEGLWEIKLINCCGCISWNTKFILTFFMQTMKDCKDILLSFSSLFRSPYDIFHGSLADVSKF